MSFQMHIPTRILFGAGKLNELHQQQMPGKKALVVISNGKSTRDNGYLERTLEQLKLAHVDYIIFDQIEANPLHTTVMNGASMGKDNKCDFVVALGGGSVLDASKAISAMMTNDGTLWDYINGGTGKGNPLTNAALPIVAITTTAGTGSEVDQWGVISNLETDEKIGFGGDESLFPVIAVVDPELMVTVPPQYTAYQGFDALFHSVECYISKMANEMSDMYALKAVENIAKYLSRAYQNGNDLEARSHVAFANTLSGIVMELSCCTSERAMEHAMSAYHHNLPHGAGLIIISKEYYQYFVNQHACDQRFIDLAKALGKKDADDPQDFVDLLVELQKTCEVDHLKMSDYGIVYDEMDTVPKNARETMGGLFCADPIELNHENCRIIFEKAYR